ncbi:hypothetical protein ACOMHN_018310 [Nucella lapillus]
MESFSNVHLGNNHDAAAVRPLKREDPAYSAMDPRGCKPRRGNPSVFQMVIIGLIIVLNISVISLAILAIQESREGGQKLKKREAVAPLCLPCQQVFGGTGREGKDKKGEEEEKGGWRRYRDGGQELCCPLHHRNLASAVGRIYDTVFEEKQKNAHEYFSRSPESYFQAFYSLPENTEQRVVFANQNKPSAHITAVEAFDANKYFTAKSNSSLQTVCDWPLRFEPYRSSTRGYVGRLTWGLTVPVSGLYRLHSMINLYFPFPQRSKKDEQTPQAVSVVHQLTRYLRAEGRTTVLSQRNTTISTDYRDGMTSFLMTVRELRVGDVISLSLSHSAAQALHRWHSQGLYLVQ